MLVLSREVINKDLYSIRTASKVGTVNIPIINPANLHIDAFLCQTIVGDQLILLDTEIRELSRKGFIIDDVNKLSKAEDLLRLKPIIDIGFELVGKQVISGNRHIGKVRDYVIETKSLYIQQILVNRLFGKLIDSDKKIVSRDQIIEINEKTIFVSGPEEKVKYQLFNKNSLTNSAD